MSGLVEAAKRLEFGTWKKWLMALDKVAKGYVIHINPADDHVLAYAYAQGQYENLFSHTLRIKVDADGVHCSESDLGKDYKLNNPRCIENWIKEVKNA